MHPFAYSLYCSSLVLLVDKRNNLAGHQALEEEAAAVRSGKLDQDMCLKKKLRKNEVGSV